MRLNAVKGFARELARSAADKAPGVWAQAKRQWSGAGSDELHPHVEGLLMDGEQLSSLHRVRRAIDVPEPPRKLLPWAFDDRPGNRQSKDGVLAAAAVGAYAVSGAMDWAPDPDLPFGKKRGFHGAWDSQGGQLLIAMSALGNTKRETVLAITDRSLLLVRVMSAHTKGDLGPAELGWLVSRTDVVQIRQTQETTVDVWFADNSWLRVWVKPGDPEALLKAFPSDGTQPWPGE